MVHVTPLSRTIGVLISNYPVANRLHIHTAQQKASLQARYTSLQAYILAYMYTHTHTYIYINLALTISFQSANTHSSHTTHNTQPGTENARRHFSSARLGICFCSPAHAHVQETKREKHRFSTTLKQSSKRPSLLQLQLNGSAPPARPPGVRGANPANTDRDSSCAV